MGKKSSDIEREIVAEIGKRKAAGLTANAASRVCGLLARKGADWDKALNHISEHFHPITSKRRHTLFAPKHREKETLRRLLLRAASGPSRVRLTKLLVNDDNVGKPAVEIRREFNEAIGTNATETSLRIFIDFQGNLITAYPDVPES